MRPTPLLTSLALLTSGPTALSALVWIGGANGGNGISLYQEANWDSDGVAGAPYATPAAGTVDGLSAINDTLIVTTGTPGGPGGASLNLWLGNSGAIQLSGGTFRLAPDYGIHADGTIGGSKASIDISGTAQLLAQFLGDQAVTVADSSTITLYGGGDPINNSTVALDTAWTGSITFDAESPADANDEHLSKITVGGSAAVTGSDPNGF